MSDIGLSYKVIESFFDRPKVVAACRASKKGNLSKAGAFVRRAARSSIRKRKKSASPGNPPSSHQGNLRNKIVFAYEAPSESVVVGPLAYNVDGGKVPALLEFGGSIRRRFKEAANGRLIRMRGQRLRPGERAIQVTQHYGAFPYMGPALDKEAPKFPELWANTVR